MSAPQSTRSESAATVVDVGRPWPGLSPFTEEQKGYFFGRDDEIDELFSCVKRDTITLLYSKSGLGKSSLLQAGLFPRLREAGFLPVYVRLKYTDISGSLESQVKSALQEAIQNESFAEVASPRPEEPLWEYLHRRGGNLISRAGDIVTPVLVFDQFEEIFTLGSTNEQARQLRERFLSCFADLVENSIPSQLRQQLADDPTLASRFDFSVTGCRFVISLREEYVTKLEGLRKVPSLAFASSRMHLQEMNGEQALLAVSQPNPELVTEDVSRLIVRFVSGASGTGSDSTPGEALTPLSDLEVAPAILSLFCRELSIKRGDLPQITSELVTGNAKTIIDDFYHRCLNDKPPALQQFIENELVTEAGFRNNVDLEDAKIQLRRAGVADTLIDDLVESRVLHIEEYRGTPRLELTHDVLLEPVKRSREKRLEQEALEREKTKERSALAEARRAQELARARLLNKLTALAVLVAFTMLGMFFYALHQKKAEAKAEQKALDNAAKAQTARSEAEASALAAQQSALEAVKARKVADANAAEARTAQVEADRKSKQLEIQSRQLEEQSKQLKEQSARLADASSLFLGTCNDIGKAFKDYGQQEMTDSASTDTTVAMFKVYEYIAGKCFTAAEKLHKADPNSYKVTAWLGEERLSMAESAHKRKDDEKTLANCKGALEMADTFSQESNYKSRLVAANTYAFAGDYLLVYLKDPSAVPTGEKGMRLLLEIQSQRNPSQFDSWDWEELADAYYAGGHMYERADKKEQAILLYGHSFDAWNNASRLGNNPDTLKFALDRAENITADARDLHHSELAQTWRQKFLIIAYDQAGRDEVYTEALKLLNADKENADARKLIDRRIQALSADPKDFEAKRQLALAYIDAAKADEALHDLPRAIQDSKQSVTILLAAKATATDPKDQKKLPDSLAGAYGYLGAYEDSHGDALYKSQDYRQAITFHQQAFEALNNAYLADNNTEFLRLAMGLAAEIYDDALKLDNSSLAAEWQQKFLAIANDHVKDDKFYTDALSNLNRQKQYSAASTLINRRVQALSDQKDLHATERLAEAYLDAAEIGVELNHFSEAVDNSRKAVAVMLAVKGGDFPDDEKSIANYLARSYGQLAWCEVLARNYAAALQDARNGLKEDPTVTWIAVNEAHALLFSGQVPEARSKYMSLKDVTYNKSRKLVNDIQSDFLQLCGLNYKNPEMATIAHDLGIKDPKLDACLASTSAQK